MIWLGGNRAPKNSMVSQLFRASLARINLEEGRTLAFILNFSIVLIRYLEFRGVK